MVPLRVHGHIYGQIIGGGQDPPVALLGGPVAPPVPTPLHGDGYFMVEGYFMVMGIS